MVNKLQESDFNFHRPAIIQSTIKIVLIGGVSGTW